MSGNNLDVKGDGEELQLNNGYYDEYCKYFDGLKNIEESGLFFCEEYNKDVKDNIKKQWLGNRYKFIIDKLKKYTQYNIDNYKGISVNAGYAFNFVNKERSVEFSTIIKYVSFDKNDWLRFKTIAYNWENEWNFIKNNYKLVIYNKQSKRIK